MDQELKEILLSMQGEMRAMHEGLAEVKSDLSAVKSDLSAVKSDLAEAKSDLSAVKSDLAETKSDLAEVKQRVTKIEVTQEQVTNKNICLLMEAQAETREKVKKLDRVAEDVEEIKIKVSALENVTRDNTSQIKELRAVK